MAGDRIRLERALEIYFRLSGLDRVSRKTSVKIHCDLMALNKDAATADVHLHDHYFVAVCHERGFYVERDQFRRVLREVRSRAQTS